MSLFYTRAFLSFAASFPKKKEKHECKISSLWKDRSFRRGFYFTLCRLRSIFSVPLSLCDWRSSRCKLCSCRDVRRNIAQRCRALPNEHCIVESEEGIRQGDSLSAFLFCAVMDKVGREILSTLTQHDISLYMYMDDITLSCLPDDANDVAAAAIQCLSQNGFNPNASKSAILFPDGTLEGGRCVLPRSSSRDFFRVLGTSVSSNHHETIEAYRAKLNKFFDIVESVRVHPQILFNIMRFCGKLKLLYIFESTPPVDVAPLGELFHARLSGALCCLLTANVPDAMMYDIHGCGMVDFCANAVDLYEHAMLEAIATSAGPVPRLSTNSFSEASIRGQADAQYLFYGGCEQE